MSLSNRFSYPDEPHEKTFTMRKPSEALLLISSNDRFTLDKRTGLYDARSENGTYNNYNISTQKIQGFGQIKRIGISEVSFPWTTPNVNERNNLFIFKGSDGVPYYTQVTEGFYTPSTLATALASALTTNLFNAITNAPTTYGIWTVTASNNVFTINNTSTWYPSLPPTGISFGNNPTSFLFYVMGIVPLEFGLISNYINTLVGGYASMAYTRYIDICSDTLCKFQTLKDSLTQQSHTNVICRIYLNGQGTNISGNNISQTGYYDFFVKFNNVKWIEYSPDNMIGSFDIRYFDDSGKLLYIPPKDQGNAQYFTMLMSES
jgi:hypothetical protein